MEVSGRKLRHYCKPCEQRKTSTYSDVVCQQCEEEMCQSCFDTHKQFKLNRDHRLVSSDEALFQGEEWQKLDTYSKEQLERIREKNTAETYEFKRDNNLAQVIKGCKQIGTIQMPTTREAAKSAFREEARQAMTEASVMKSQTSLKRQPLLERQLISKNLNIDGDTIRYCEQKLGDFGIFVDNKRLKRLDSFEIEILAVNSKVGSIAIGVIPEDYPDNLLPGVGQDSSGYYSNGKMYKGRTTGKKCGKSWRVGDKIIIAIEYRIVSEMCCAWRGAWFVIFTHNGKEIIGDFLSRDLRYHFTIGMESGGGGVKVKFHS